MTVDALEYLRAEDPVPDGSTAPPMDWVLGQIERAEAQPRRRRFAIPLMPTVAVAATLAVVAAVVVLAVTHRGPAPAHVPPADRTTPTVRRVPSPESLMPRGGMRGTLLIQGAASPSANHAVIYFDQCQPCHAGSSGAGSASHVWRAATIDSGASWHVARASADLSMFAFGGADGWAEGMRSDRTASFFASRDGGRSWHLASSADPAPGGVGGVSIAGGEVWSLGNRCTGSNCVDTVLRAPASSDHLAETATQPPLGDSTNVSVVAAGRDDAYVLTNVYGTLNKVATITHTQLFASHDGGRTWRALRTPCPHLTFGRLNAGGTQSLWATCSPMRGPGELRRSTDGGVHWTTLTSRPGNVQLQPASAQVAWATTPAGKVLRTSNGGRTWASAWYAGHPEPAALAGTIPPGLNRAWGVVLTVQSPTTATVVAVVTSGRVEGHAGRTNFVSYRTTDGGQTWRPSVVRLPTG